MTGAEVFWCLISILLLAGIAGLLGGMVKALISEWRRKRK